MIIKKSTDLFNFRRLHKRCFPSDEFDFDDNTHFWIVYDGLKSIGFCALKTLDSEIVFFSRAGVEQKYKNKGLHKEMIKRRVSWAKRNGYKVAITYVKYDNPLSLRNLIKCGFDIYVPEWEYAGEQFIYVRKSL